MCNKSKDIISENTDLGKGILRITSKILKKNSGTFKENRRKIFEEVNEQIELIDKIYRDDLTGLLNRTALNEIIKGGKKYSVIAMDLNELKRINDTFGHLIADRILEKIGEIIYSSIRTNNGDKAFRTGGDEFIVLIGEGEITAKKIEERIKTKINNYNMNVDGKIINVNLSFGIHEKNELNLKKSIERADKMLIKNKPENGKGHRLKNSIESIQSQKILLELLQTTIKTLGKSLLK